MSFIVAYCWAHYPATSCLPRICLRGNVFIEPLPNCGSTRHNILHNNIVMCIYNRNFRLKGLNWIVNTLKYVLWISFIYVYLTVTRMCLKSQTIPVPRDSVQASSTAYRVCKITDVINCTLMNACNTDSVGTNSRHISISFAEWKQDCKGVRELIIF
jgi:hypothetical protein